MDAGEQAGASRTFDLLVEHELRFEVPCDCADATLTLMSGSAEVFGVEMAVNRAYSLSPGLNAAAFTWFGARLTLFAPSSALAYTATDTPMPDYIRVHAVLQSRRDRILQAGDPAGGPRTVIVGPRDSGKTALANILCAYCVKANSSSILVDLDPAASGASAVVPGAFAVSVVSHVDIEEGGPVHDRVSATMYGHVSALDNLIVVKKLMSSVTTVLDGLLAEQKNVPHAGCIVDTCGDVDGTEGLDLVVAGITAVRADIVLVLGGERLFASIRSRLTDSRTEVVLLSKSGGVVSRDNTIRQHARSRRIKEYFYGPDNRLNPFSTVIDFASVTVMQIAGQAAVVPDSVLPIGFESTLDPLKPNKVSLSRDLLHALLGVSQAEVEDEVLCKPVYGFVHVSKVDVDRNTLTVLAPSPGRIPSNFLIQGSIKWME
jgi:polyribonucleotide 5'-hydroxyl-kinase